jgi:murein L,D-transpeptidase YcbB/YkuD
MWEVIKRWLVSIASYISIALRMITHRDEISQTWAEVQLGAANLQRLVPQVQNAITESMRLMAMVTSLMQKVAPELALPALAIPGQPEPVFDVRWLQQSLNDLIGAGLVVDGDYGLLTKGAVEEFQRREGLDVDGWAGIETEARIVMRLAERAQARLTG